MFVIVMPCSMLCIAKSTAENSVWKTIISQNAKQAPVPKLGSSHNLERRSLVFMQWEIKFSKATCDAMLSGLYYKYFWNGITFCFKSSCGFPHKFL